jgi:hypothetical protein
MPGLPNENIGKYSPTFFSDEKMQTHVKDISISAQTYIETSLLKTS